MKCIRCGVVIADRHPILGTHEPEFCSDSCEDEELEGLDEFLNRLRILRSLDGYEVQVTCWEDFRDDPYEYLIRCPEQDEVAHIWTALRKREE